MEFKVLGIDEIKPNDYNPNGMTEKVFNQLKSEIKRIGFLDPVLVRKEGNSYVIVDGEHRWKASKESGLKEIPVVITDMDELQAMVETYNSNSIKGLINPLKFAKLIDDLKVNYSISDLSNLFNIDETILQTPKDIGFNILSLFIPIDKVSIIEEALNKTEQKTLEKQFITIINKWEDKKND